MHFFIVSCLLGVAAATQQGYNNQRFPEQGLPQQALLAPEVQHYSSGSQVIKAYSTSAQHNHNSVHQPQLTQLGGNVGHHSQPQQQLISKDIYVHVPPADEPEIGYPQSVLPPAPPRKHYRIVFIKTPTPSATKTALRIKEAPVEEKTIIYVLTKKTDPLDLQTAIEKIAPKQISKPEVFFIKYKTQEEAEHAQRTIQAQYDQLGGTSQVSDEGIAPVTSVIGVLDNHRTSGVSTGKFSVSLANNYLPSNLNT